MAVAAAAESAKALNQDPVRLTEAFENYCTVRNWMDYTIVAVGGIEWINSPALLNGSVPSTSVPLTKLLPKATILMENIRSL